METNVLGPCILKCVMYLCLFLDIILYAVNSVYKKIFNLKKVTFDCDSPTSTGLFGL